MRSHPGYGRLFGAAFVVTVGALGCGPTAPESIARIQRLNAAVSAERLPAVEADTCMRVHEVWRDQLRVAADAAVLPRRSRAEAWLEGVYRPYQSFWDGYVGGEKGFQKRVVGRWTDLETDPRTSVPLEIDVRRLIVETTREAAAFAGRTPACTDWHLVYGPGWTNLGGGPMGMLVDFFGLPKGREVEDLTNAMPHEVAHLIFSRTHADDPDKSTLLHRIVEEGFVSYFTVQYAAGTLTPAQALGYSHAEWEWAKRHERELWGLAAPKLQSSDPDVITAFRSASARIMEGAPTKIGYFLGYRIAERYVTVNGPDSWREIFDLPLASVLSRSGYGRAHE